MKRIAAVLTICMLLAAGAALASPGEKGGPEGFGHGRGHGMGIVKMVDELQLTPDQKHAVAKLLKENQEKSKALHESMRAAFKHMHEVMDKTPGDEAAVRAAAKEMAKAGEEMAVNKGKLKASIDAVLTPEQKATWAKKREEFKKKFEERFKERSDKGPNKLDEWIEQNIK